jgi:hypothetical protein
MEIRKNIKRRCLIKMIERFNERKEEGSKTEKFMMIADEYY